jgi:hypothetical protein
MLGGMELWSANGMQQGDRGGWAFVLVLVLLILWQQEWHENSEASIL